MSAFFSTLPWLAQCILSGSAKWKWAVNLQMWVNCVCLSTFLSTVFCRRTVSASVGGTVRLGKHFERAPHWTLPFSFPQSLPLFPPPSSSCFPSLAGKWSQAVFPHPRVTSRNSQTYRHQHTHSFCLSRPCPTLVWLLTAYGPHFGLKTEKQVFPLSTWLLWLRVNIAVWLFWEMLSW